MVAHVRPTTLQTPDATRPPLYLHGLKAEVSREEAG
jgi:hypothetical protein